jgi:hypothetical protein
MSVYKKAIPGAGMSLFRAVSKEAGANFGIGVAVAGEWIDTVSGINNL